MKLARIFTLLLGMSLAMGWPLVSLAHVHMDRSVPEDGAHLKVAPKVVQVWFSGKVAAEWSAIEVTDAQGQRVDEGEATNAGDPRQLDVGLKPLGSGTYAVKLNVISGDGHRVKGSFSFVVE